MLTPARLGLFACALFLAGCGKSDEIDDPPIQRLVGDWAPAVLENCDLRVKFGSNAIYVLRDGKTYKISQFFRLRIDGDEMRIVLNEGAASKVLVFKTSQNKLKLTAVLSPKGEELGDSISDDADEKIKYLSMRPKALFDLNRCVAVQ